MDYSNSKNGKKLVKRAKWLNSTPTPAVYTVMTFLAVVMLSSSNVSAAAKQCGDVATFFDWGCKGKGEQITPVLITILNWMAVGVTIAVIGGIIYGAIMYTTSGGNQQQAQKAMGIIRNAFIALIMYFVAWSALNWLVPGGLFN